MRCSHSDARSSGICPRVRPSKFALCWQTPSLASATAQRSTASMVGAEAGAGPSDLGADGVQPGPQPSTIIYQGKKGYKMVRQYLMGDMLGEGAQGKVKEAVGFG